MTPFTTLTGIAAPLPIANVDTDTILPAAFLTTVSRSGLGQHLFHDLRYGPAGEPRADFILNRDPWTKARILVSLDNFGCGSSREHAVWALSDFGIACIVAPSFGEIFEANCFRNGVLPLRLPRAEVDRLLALAAPPATAGMTVDLVDCSLAAGGTVTGFCLPGRRREQLLSGEDDIAVSLSHEAAIAAYENSALGEEPFRFFRTRPTA